MKRLLFILMLFSTLTLSAQDYQHSAGIYAGSNGYAKGTVIECSVFFDWTAGVALRYRMGK